MSRIEPATRRVVVTGVGFRHDSTSTASGNIFAGKGIKPNIGAAVALEAARSGYAMVLISRTKSKLDVVRSSILELVSTADIQVQTADLLENDAMRSVANSLPKACVARASQKPSAACRRSTQ